MAGSGWRCGALLLPEACLSILCSQSPCRENLQVPRLLVDGRFHVFYIDGFQDHQSSWIFFSVYNCGIFFKLLPGQFGLVFYMVVVFNRPILQVACQVSRQCGSRHPNVRMRPTVLSSAIVLVDDVCFLCRRVLVPPQVTHKFRTELVERQVHDKRETITQLKKVVQ